MESAALARNGYSQATRQIKTARDIEYEAFAKVTSRLRSALERPEDHAALVTALHENREFWTLLAVDLVDPDNGLPQKLKAQIFALADFTFRQTGKILSGQGAADVLIDINSAMMAGLRDKRVLA